MINVGDIIRSQSAVPAQGTASAEARDATAALLADPDAGVRSWTLRALGQTGLATFRDRVVSLAETDPAPAVQAQARRLLGS